MPKPMIFLSMLPLIFALRIAAQSEFKVQGLVVDAVSGAPLPNAAVQVVGAAAGATTDVHGRFAVERLLVGEYFLQARCIGYEPASKSVRVVHDQPVQCTFYLQPRILHLEDVQIVGGRWRPDGAGRSIVIGLREILRSQARDVAELLQNAAGLEVRSDGAVKTASLQGSQANQVQILLNGVRLGSPLTGQVDLTSLPLTAVKEVVIFPNAAGALAGVIDIRTGAGPTSGLAAKTYMESYNGSGFNLSWSQKRRPLNYSLNIDSERSLSDYPYSYVHADQEVHDRRKNADSRKRQLFFESAGGLAGGSWNVMAQSVRSDRGLPGLVYAWTPWARSFLKRDLYQLAYSHETCEIKAAWQAERSQYRNTYGDVPLRYRNTPPYWTENRFDDASLSAGWHKRMAFGHLYAGVEGRYTDFSDHDFITANAPIGHATNWSTGHTLQLQKPWTLSERLVLGLNGGYRFDHAILRNDDKDRSETQFSPFITIVLRRQDDIGWEFQGSWSHGFRLPTFADLFYQQYRTRGNIDLAPEKSVSKHAAAVVFWPGSHKGSLRLQLFHNRIRDLIIWRMGSFATFTPVNADALLQGVEIEGELSLIRRWQITASHVFLQTRNLTPERTVYGKQLPYRSHHSAKLAIHGDLGRFGLEYGLRYAGARYVTEANTISLPGYVVQDLSMSLTAGVADVMQSFKLSVYNVADQRYQIVENAPLPGREWRLVWQISQPFNRQKD